MSWVKQFKQDYTIYQCQELNNTNIIQAISTKDCGNMGLHTGDLVSRVIKNREKFLAAFGLEIKNLVAAQQIHGRAIQTVSEADKGIGAISFAEAISETDALITKDRGVILSIFTADCLPIFIYDPVTPAIGIVHAGWRGTLQRIAEHTILKMQQEFGTTPANCLVAIGPAICSKCFRVGPDLVEQFKIIYPDVVAEDSQGFLIDLYAFHRNLLQSTGIPAEHIYCADFCTSCEKEQFFSYRAEGGTMGRMMGIIALQ